MSTYLLILLLTISFPLLRSFEPKIRFVSKWPFVLLASISVAVPFLIWDAIFTEWGIWSFSYDHTLNLRLVGLPIEEILFFILAPFSCIFIWECVKLFVKESSTGINQFIWLPALVLLVVGVTHGDRVYTFTVFAITSLFLFLLNILSEKTINTNRFWITMALCFLGFLIVNYLLTSIPVVSYDDTENLGIRFLTIPLEDFVYNFLLIAANIIVYEHLLFYRTAGTRSNRV